MNFPTAVAVLINNHIEFQVHVFKYVKIILIKEKSLNHDFRITILKIS